jgi:predicted nucleotidyltransferase
MKDPFSYPGLRVLLVFFNEPYREFHLREVARYAEVGSGTAKRYLDFYVEKDFLQMQRKANLALFKANVENPALRYMKVGYFITKVRSLIDYLEEIYPNSSVVLYGSCARGEDDPKSDIDLLVISRKKAKADLNAFERKFERKITLLVYEPDEWDEKARKDRAFYERILIDGIAMKGNLPVVRL